MSLCRDLLNKRGVYSLNNGHRHQTFLTQQARLKKMLMYGLYQRMRCMHGVHRLVPSSWFKSLSKKLKQFTRGRVLHGHHDFVGTLYTLWWCIECLHVSLPGSRIDWSEDLITGKGQRLSTHVTRFKIISQTVALVHKVFILQNQTLYCHC